MAINIKNNTYSGDDATNHQDQYSWVGCDFLTTEEGCLEVTTKSEECNYVRDNLDTRVGWKLLWCQCLSKQVLKVIRGLSLDSFSYLVEKDFIHLTNAW